MRKRKSRLQIFAGAGTRVFSALGTMAVSAKGGGRISHPWKCALASVEMSMRLGLVNGMEPYVDGRLMSGLDKDGKADPKGVPKLKLDTSLYDETGRSYLCVRVRVGAGGKLPQEYKASDLSIIQSKEGQILVGEVGQFVIAVLRRAKTDGGVGTLRQVVRHDLQHGIGKDGEKFRHWFFPAG